MAQIILNINGASGLANKYAGDADIITSQPNLRIDVKDGEIASGYFNPYLRTGYLAPITTNTTTITTDTTLTTALNFVEYDIVNDNVYWANSGRLIYKGDSSSDTSLTQLIQLPTGAEITDLEIYELDSQPALYYLYNYPADTDIKAKAIFLGTTILAPNNGARLYDSAITKNGSALTSIGITVDGYDKMSQPFNTSSFSNAGSSTITVDGARMLLRMPFAGTSQIWTLKVGIWTATLSTLTDGTQHYTPVTEVVSTTVSPSTLPTVDFKDTYVSFTPTTLSNATVYCLVLEATVTADIGTNEGVDWLSGATTGSTNFSALTYQGSSWVRPTITVDNIFDFAILAKTSSTILNQTNRTYVDNMLPMYQKFATGNYSTTSSNTTSIVVADNPNNIVIVAVTIKSGTDLLTGVTIGGSAMTAGSNQNGNTGTRTYTYYKKSVAAGTQSIVASFSSAVESILDGISVINIDTTQTITNTAVYKNTVGDPAELYTTTPYGGAVSVQAIIFTNTSSINYGRIYNDTFPGGGSVVHDAEHSVAITPYGAIPQRINWFKPIETVKTISSWNIGSMRYNGVLDQNGYTMATYILNGIYSSNTTSSWPLLGSRSGSAFMRKADNGFAYIFSDTSVHKFDGGITGGGTGVLTKDVLKFPSYFQIVDALDYRSDMYIAVHHYPVSGSTPTNKTFKGMSSIVIWNKSSTQISKTDVIEVPGAREIRKIYLSSEGILKLITISDTGLVELRQFEYNGVRGTIFGVKKELGIGAFPLRPDSFTIAGDKAIWLGNDGVVYTEKTNFITQLFEAKAPGTTTATMLTNISGGAVFYGSNDETSSSGFRSNKQTLSFSYLDSSTSYTKKIYPFDTKDGANATQTPHIGNVFSGVQYIPITSVVRNIRVYNNPITGSGSATVATVKIYFNQSTTVGMTKTITKAEAKRGYVDFKINKPYINAIQLKVEWDTSITLDSDVYLPSVAIITSDEAKTQSPDNG